jgi:hypothetical protein
LSDRAIGNAPRRRRSWYQRRLLVRRTLAGAALVALIAAVCWQNAARFFPLPSLHASSILPNSFWKRPTPRQDLALSPSQGSKHPRYVARVQGVYPYSVVPGGVKNPRSLREVAARDHAVARHYAQFNYSKAHLVRVTEPREVYVSYRIRDTVFWTHKKIRLQTGELLLTDGKITARAKCGNQVSETAKPDVSDQEPEEDVLEQPVALEPFGPSLPLRPAFGRPGLPGGQVMAPMAFASAFSFPYASFGGGFPACKADDKHCHPHHKPPKTPEPGTIVLLASGLVGILWLYRTNRRALHT